MTSDRTGAARAYTWVWLPGADEPVVAGALEERGGEASFIYGRSYLDRDDAFPLYLPELPLRTGRIPPLPGLDAPGCILDARPDAWGQRVILNRLFGGGFDGGTGSVEQREPGLVSLLLLSGPNRIGALDFTPSPGAHPPAARGSPTLEELVTSAERVENGVPLTDELDAALLHGSSVGGARPKALIDDEGTALIAKFASSADPYPVVRGEFVAMELARRAGLDVANVRLVEAMGKAVLLVERFDRTTGGPQRRALVSALTLLELPEHGARYASYAALCEVIRKRFRAPAATLRELYSRLTFNVLCGNNDDHARNHAAFWDGGQLSLTPAYDICPQPRNTGRATQAMVIGHDGFKESQVAGCIERAGQFLLSEQTAREIVEAQIATIERHWDDVCDLAGLSEVDRRFFWHRQFLSEFGLRGHG